jgi:hypothetical protein
MIKILRVGDPPGGTNTVLENPRVLLDVPAPVAEARVTTPLPQYALNRPELDSAQFEGLLLYWL